MFSRASVFHANAPVELLAVVYRGNRAVGESIQELRKHARFEEEVAVHDQKIVVADKVRRGADGVGRAELLRLFNI